jgi:hypothetical protein
MDTILSRTVGLAFRAATLLLALGVYAGPAAADQARAADAAIIKNSPQVPDSNPKEVTLTKLDGGLVDVNQEEIAVPPGEHELEVLCVIRQQAGMGQAAQRSKTRLTLKAEPRHTYQLNGKLEGKDKCVAHAVDAHQ